MAIGLRRAITEKAKEIAYSETRRLLDRTPKSKLLYERALNSLPQGVGSSFQAGDPYPIYLREGRGSQVWDVDGTQYVDTHGGFGCMIVGHAHPKIVEAITRAAQTGTHFAAPTEDMVLFAEELCRRFRLEKVRFANSGTEATMSAIRVARAATGRDDIVKVEGSYHGHHDPVMFSVVPNSDLMGGRDQPSSAPMSLGVPKYLEGPHARGAVQRSRRARATARGARRHDRLHDHRTGDDEHRHRRARSPATCRA